MVSYKKEMIASYIGATVCCVLGILFLVTLRWLLSIPFFVGEGVAIWLLDRIDKRAHPLAYSYRKVLWGSHSVRFFIQWLPGYAPTTIFLIAYIFSSSLLISYVLSIVLGIAVSLAASSLFLRSFKSYCIPEFDELHIPFEFKAKKVMETPEELPILNAWSAGIISPGLVVTSALLRYLNKGELRAVILHEVGHAKGRHMLFLSVYGAFYIPSFLLLFFSGHILAGSIAFVILTVLFVWLRHLSELKADEFAVKVAGEGEDLINALQKITRTNNETASRALGTKGQGNVSLSHPSLDRRIKRIRMISNDL